METSFGTVPPGEGRKLGAGADREVRRQTTCPASDPVRSVLGAQHRHKQTVQSGCAPAPPTVTPSHFRVLCLSASHALARVLASMNPARACAPIVGSRREAASWSFQVSSSLLRWLKLDAEWAKVGLHDARGRSTTIHGIRAGFNTTLRRNSTDPALRMRL